MTIRSDLLPQYTWSSSTGRYRGSDGRFVAASEIRAEVELVIEGVQKEIRALGRALTEGNITIAGFQELMAEQVLTLHLATTVAARGGFATLDQAALDRVSERVARQLEYLQGFAVDIEQGRQHPAGIEWRSAAYAQAARRSFEAERLLVDKAAGLTQERNILGVADHCPDCLSMTRRGWVEIGTLIPIGERVCTVSCRCEIERRGHQERG